MSDEIAVVSTTPNHDLLVELDGNASHGRWVQYNPRYCPEAKGDKNVLNYDTSHDMSAVYPVATTPEGEVSVIRRKKLGTWQHASDAHFAQTLVNLYRDGKLKVLE